MTNQLLKYDEALKTLEKPNVYIIDYQLDDTAINLKTNTNTMAQIKYSKTVIAKLNKLILDNRQKVLSVYQDDYRLKVWILFANLIILALSGALIPFSFILGDIQIFYIVIVFFLLNIFILLIMVFKLLTSVNNLREFKHQYSDTLAITSPNKEEKQNMPEQRKTLPKDYPEKLASKGRYVYDYQQKKLIKQESLK